MKVPIIKIGNSRGILLNKTILETYGFEEQLEMVMKEDYIELKPVQKSRSEWDEAFTKMHEMGEDRLIINESPDEDIMEEWK